MIRAAPLSLVQRGAASALGALVLLAGTFALEGCRAGAQSPAAKKSVGAKKKMIQLTVLKGDDEINVSAPRRTLRAGAAASTPSAAPAPGPGYTRAYANESQNSRIPFTLGTGAWSPAWKLPISSEFPARFVLAMGDRSIVHARQWHLVDSAGRSLVNDRLGGGPIVIDQALKAFLTHYTSAYLSMRRLADGRELFKYLPGQGDVYSRAFLTRHGSRMLIQGWERSLDPHGHKKAENSRVEILDLGKPPKADDFGFLSSASTIGELYIGWVGVQMATAGAVIVAAAANEIYLLDWDLNVKQVFDGSFEPNSLSLDEAGNIYMAGQSGGASHVWKITPAGEIAFDFTLPTPAVLEHPPIVGYDHTVYQLSGGHIYALGDNGRLRWSRASEGTLAGGVVTADHQLMTSEGSCVAAYDAKGERRKVVCLDGESLTSPAILNEAGHMLVASKTHLHSLRTK